MRVPTQDKLTDFHRLLIMLVFSLGAFGIGTTEFVSMGLLSYVAQDFGITEDTAGRMISIYAAGVMVGAPLTAIAGAKIPRRTLLLILMAAFTVGNALCIIAPSYSMILIARFIAGLPHGAYFSVTSLAASSLAKPGERGKAIAFVGMGLPVACVVGVPATQAIGGALGWHTAYVIVSLIGLATLVGLAFFMPHMTKMKLVSPLDELGAVRNPVIIVTLLMGAIGFGGMFAVYTYISWTMGAAGLAKSSMWMVLMCYGVGMVIGNWVGGRVADRALEKGLGVSLVGMIAVLFGFYAVAHHVIPTAIMFGLVGFTGSCFIPPLQIRLMDYAGKAQTLAAAMAQSALNLANAGGAALGGWVIESGHEYRATALAGALLPIVALVLWAATYSMVQARRPRMQLA